MDRERIIKDYSYYLRMERNLSPNTVSAYVSDVGDFLETVSSPPSGIVSDEIAEYMGALSDKLSKRTQSRVLSSLKSFFDYLVLEGDRTDNPCDRIDSPKLGRYLPDVLSVGEVAAIIESVRVEAPSGRRDRAILEMLYGCGLRVSELCSLRISHVYADEGFVRIVGKGNKERLVPLGEPAAEAFISYLEVRGDAYAPMYDDIAFLNRFGKPLSRVAVFNMIKKQALAAGVVKNISPHTFRHSFATHMIENGADLRVVQEMLGHESVLTTEIYTHIDAGTWQSNILSHHPRNK